MFPTCWRCANWSGIRFRGIPGRSSQSEWCWNLNLPLWGFGWICDMELTTISQLSWDSLPQGWAHVFPLSISQSTLLKPDAHLIWISERVQESEFLPGTTWRSVCLLFWDAINSDDLIATSCFSLLSSRPEIWALPFPGRELLYHDLFWTQWKMIDTGLLRKINRQCQPKASLPSWPFTERHHLRFCTWAALACLSPGSHVAQQKGRQGFS